MSIGGNLNYAALAQVHRPTDPMALRAEVRRLAASQRLTAVDIATALNLNLVQVREMLGDGDKAARP